MKYIHNIIEYFRKQYGVSQSSKNNKIQNIPQENSISFSIDEWNRFVLKIKLEIHNNAAYEEFGKLLYFIQQGKYEENIVDTLLNMISKQNLNRESAQKIMSGWATLLAEDLKTDNQLCVKPTEVFNRK